jgi:putative endonuclease
MLAMNNRQKAAFSMRWQIYIIECRDGSLYTGITINLEKRLAAHNAGKGAKYTTSRRPVQLVYREGAANRSEASKRENAIKRMNRHDKLVLCAKQDSL